LELGNLFFEYLHAAKHSASIKMDQGEQSIPTQLSIPDFGYLQPPTKLSRPYKYQGVQL
jgi:hypothetical protein